MPTIQFEEQLRRGLRPFSGDRNSRFLAVMTNLRPDERGARALYNPAYPLTSPESLTMAWPSPQLIKGEQEQLLLCGATSISAVTPSGTPWTSSAYTPREPYLGSNLTASSPDGTFASETGWGAFLGNGTFAAAGGVCVASGATGTKASSSSSVLTVGKKYKVVFTVVSVSNGAVCILLGTTSGTPKSTTGTFTEYLTCADNGTLSIGALTFTGSIDNLCVYELAANAVTTGGTWHIAPFQDYWVLTNGVSLVWKLPGNINDEINCLDTSSTGGFTVATVCNAGNRLVMGGIAGSNLLSHANWAKVFAAWQKSEIAADARRDMFLSEDQVVDGSWLYISDRGGGAVDVPLYLMLASMNIPNSTAFSTLEGAILSKVEANEMPLIPCREAQEVYRAMSFEGDIMVYGKGAVSRLRETNRGYVEEQPIRVGCGGRGCAGGSMLEQVFVSDQKELFFVGARGQSYDWAQPVGRDVYRLGYQEYLTNLTLASTVVCYDPQEKAFFIGDGTYGYTLTRTGFCRSNGIIPSSVVRVGGYSGLVGTCTKANPSATATITTEVFDGDVKGVKDLSFVKIATNDTDTDGWDVTPQYRMRKADSLSDGTLVNADVRGHARVKQTGLEHAIKLTADDRTKVDLDRIEAEVEMISNAKPSLRSVIGS